MEGSKCYTSREKRTLNMKLWGEYLQECFVTEQQNKIYSEAKCEFKLFLDELSVFISVHIKKSFIESQFCWFYFQLRSM
jgi:hypothetical protein